ncbi:hypothetical protein [Singulisphaera sp. PoT]|uniref:hypothetical protein n=1 Tax=Singulisphaera sp. PoT TaxID=3411797 RepID=UPI003BF5B1BD
MAKKRNDASPEPPQASKPRETIMSLKGTPEWSTWLAELATKFRTTKVGIIDRALAEFAERNNFQEPPER